jgi:hypothetical protein
MCKNAKNTKLLLLTATPATHTPEEIIDIVNILNYDILSGKRKPITYKEIFQSHKVTEKGIKILKEVSKGYVSYFRGYNLYTYPKRLDEGTIGLCKFNKMVQLPMKGLQLSTYNARIKNGLPGVVGRGKNAFGNFYSEGKFGRDEWGAMNMVFPNPKDPKIGVFTNMDILQLRNAPRAFLNKHKIIFYQRPNGRYQLTGDFLKKNNLQKYSAKYLYLLNYLENVTNKNNGHIFIYSHLVEGTGTRLIGEILHRNGYAEYSGATGTSEAVVVSAKMGGSRRI